MDKERGIPSDADAAIHFETMRELALQGDPEAIAFFIQSLAYKGPRRDSVLHTLTHIGESLGDTLYRYRDSPQWRVRAGIATLLGNIKGPHTTEALLLLVQDTRHEVRQDAASALGRLGDPRAIAALAHALDDSDAGVRRSAAVSLAKMGEGAIPVLGELVGHAHLRVRETAIFACGLLGTPTIVPRLLPLLDDPSVVIRTATVEALGRIGGAAAVDLLIARLDDAEYQTRRAAFIALTQIGEPRAIPALLRIVEADDLAAWDWVETKLVVFGTALVSPLRTVLQMSPNAELRRLATRLLGKIGALSLYLLLRAFYTMMPIWT